MSTVFDVLGISPDAQIREIKKAYAARLKSIDVRQEIERFQELRHAYEVACRFAENVGQSDSYSPPPQEPSQTNQIENSSTTATFPIQHETLPVPTSGCVGEHAEKVLGELSRDYAADPLAEPQTVLARLSASQELLALDEKERFEQILLVWIFEPELKIDWLDAATDLFSWEMANHHLYAWRHDLALRVSNHQELRHLIHSVRGDEDLIENGRYYYAQNCECNAGDRMLALPKTTRNGLARLLQRLEERYPVETKERFTPEITYWKSQIAEWRGTLHGNPLPRPKAVQPKLGGASIWPALLLVFLVGLRGQLDLPRSPPVPPYSKPTANKDLESELNRPCAYSEAALAEMPQEILSQRVSTPGFLSCANQRMKMDAEKAGNSRNR